MSDLTHRAAATLTLLAAVALALPAGAQTTTPASPPSPAPSVIPAVPPVPEAVAGRPLGLGEAVTLALRQNLQVQQAALQVAVARAQLQQAEAGPQPKVSGQASYTSATATPLPLGGTISIPSASITNAPFTAGLASQTTGQTYLFNLVISYPLYTGNALEDQIAIARANVQSAEAAFTATAAQVVLSVRQAYYNLQLQQGTVDAAQRAVNAARENARVADARVRAGAAPKFDLLQAQVQLAQSQQALTRAKTGAVQGHQTLASLLNVPLSTTTAPATPLGLEAPPADMDALIQQALRTRPELTQAQANVEAAQAAIDLAAAGLRPNITLTGGPSIQTTDPSRTNTVGWSGGVQLTLAILDGGLTQAKVEAARQQLQQTRVAETQTRQSVELDVRNAYLGLQDAAEELKSAQAALDAAREAFRIAAVRYQAGVGTQLEVVTAEQNRATADVGAVQALFAYNLALAQLDRAVGVQVKI